MKKLSRRELDVLELLKEGYKNKLIATVLGLDEKTISTYIRRIKIKIGFNGFLDSQCNTYAIVKKGIELGLIKEND